MSFRATLLQHDPALKAVLLPAWSYTHVQKVCLSEKKLFSEQ